MNIIIEGPDNVGKSTLISNLKNHYNTITLHNLHYSNVKGSNIEYCKKLYFEMFSLLTSDKSFICDRSHLGEMVYGPLYRDYSGEFVLDIEKQFDTSEITLITLIDDAESLIERDDGLSFSTDIDIKRRELSNFINAHVKSNIKNKLLVNIKDFNEELLKNHIIKFINKE